MNKIINNLTNIRKSFYGLIIYFAVNMIFSYIIKSNNDNLDYFTYNSLLISSELLTFILLIIVFRKKLKKDFKDFDQNYKKYLFIGFKFYNGYIKLLYNNVYHK